MSAPADAKIAGAVSAQRLQERLDALAGHSEPTRDPRGVTRRVFSPEHRAARRYLEELCAAEGLAVREDPAGVLFARWEPPGCDPGLPAVATGSHIDAIPESGRYDGTVGVLGGLEAIAALRSAGAELRRPIELLDFAEEPTVFGVGCLQSRILSGFLDAEEADALVAEDGQSTLRQLRHAVGLDRPLAESVLPPGHYSNWLELHIEQGPRLEAAGLQIGVVTHISASATLRLRFLGQGGHAGAMLMAERTADAFAAAASFGSRCRELALASQSEAAVCTVGQFVPFPGATNSVPSEVQLSVDVRDRETASRDALLEQLVGAAEEEAERFGARVEVAVLHQDPAAHASPEAVAAVTASAQALGLSFCELGSYAYHDTTFMSLVCPAAMIFVPSRDGISHRPDELTESADLAAGVAVLALALARLAA